jgi:hypothetical protein
MALPYGTERNVKFSGLLGGYAYRNARCELFEESVISGFRTTSAELVHGTLLATCVGYGVAQLVEALRYESEGRGFDSRWCHWNF